MKLTKTTITFKEWDTTVSISKEPSPGTRLSAYFEMCRSLALAVGYSPSQVAEYFGESKNLHTNLKEFAEKLAQQENLDPEINKIVNDSFWDLI